MQQNIFQTLLKSRLLIVVEVLIVISLGVVIAKEAVRRHDISSEVGRLEQQINKLEEQNIQLASTLKEMMSDNYVEKEARKKLDVQRQGETVVLVPSYGDESQSQDQEESSARTNSVSKNPESNAQQWWNYFFSSSS